MASRKPPRSVRQEDERTRPLRPWIVAFILAFICIVPFFFLQCEDGPRPTVKFHVGTLKGWVLNPSVHGDENSGRVTSEALQVNVNQGNIGGVLSLANEPGSVFAVVNPKYCLTTGETKFVNDSYTVGSKNTHAIRDVDIQTIRINERILEFQISRGNHDGTFNVVFSVDYQRENCGSKAVK